MTLKVRNRILLIALGVSAFFCVAGIAFFVFSGVRNAVSAPSDAVRTFTLFPTLFPYRFSAVIAGIIVLLLYVPVTMFSLYFSFEKTQALEVIFFIGFLSGCFFEGVRLLFPIDSLWKTSSTTLIVLGKLVLTGRILSYLSLLAASLLSGIEQRQYVERNIVIVVLTSFLIGFAYPLNTLHTTSTCTVLWGYRTLFLLLRFCLFLATAGFLFTKVYTEHTSFALREALGYTATAVGYSMLCATDSYAFFVAGTLLLAVGTVLYLRTIHRRYLWQ